MFERTKNWPTPITEANWRSLDLSEIEAETLPEGRDQLLKLFNILKNTQTGLRATFEDRELDLELPVSPETLLQAWLRILNGVHEAAKTDSPTLMGGNINLDGNWAQLGLNYDSSLDRYVISDPYIINTSNLSISFGRVYELGKSLVGITRAAKGGKKSLLSRTAIEIVDKEIENKRKSVLDSLAAEAEERVSQIKTLEASRDWSSEYNKRVVEYEREASGWAFKRLLWFIAVLLTLSSYTVFVVLAATHFHGLALDSLGTLNGFSKYIVGVTFYGALGAVFLGYGFTARQLKINRNLLEQYRHRAVVAKTIESIVGAVIQSRDGSNEETSITQAELSELVRVAALAMFEHRSIGQLGAKENANPLLEIINTARG